MLRNFFWVFVVLVLAFGFNGAAYSKDIVRLQCDGKYSNFREPDMHDLPIDGIYIEVLDGKIKISGATGFESDFLIIRNSAAGIGFYSALGSTQEGYLNRYSGRLSLSEREIYADSNGPKLKILINAKCKKAAPIF